MIFSTYQPKTTIGRKIKVYLTFPERTRKELASYDTSCLQCHWLSTNVGPQFTCGDEGGDKVRSEIEGDSSAVQSTVLIWHSR